MAIYIAGLILIAIAHLRLENEVICALGTKRAKIVNIVHIISVFSAYRPDTRGQVPEAKCQVPETDYLSSLKLMVNLKNNFAFD